MMADGKPVSPPTGTDIGAPGLVAEPPPDVAPSGPSRNVAAAPPVRPEPSSGATLVPETPEDPESAAPALGRLARVVARAAEAVVGKLAYPVEEAHLGPDRPMPLATSLPRGPSVANAAVPPEISQNGVETAAPPAPVRPVTPPPPYAGGPTAGQPPVSASIQPDASPRELGRILLVDTDAALARQTLLQAASLPDGSDPSQRSAPPRWMFEIPLATPQGTAVAQFEIARDPRRATRSADATPAWRARFSIDIEPLGPVHAQIVLTHARTAITLWAERPASAALLQQDAPLLARALNNAELEGGDVLVRGGEPPRAAADAGRFLDRAL